MSETEICYREPTQGPDKRSARNGQDHYPKNAGKDIGLSRSKESPAQEMNRCRGRGMGDVEEPGKTTFIRIGLEDVDIVSVLKRGRLQSGFEISTDLWREGRRP